MAPKASQVAVLAAAFVTVAACESPARVKPWRHAPDPTAEAQNVQGSPALAQVSPSEVRAARKHTLRIQLDAEPGRLNPLVSPTLWGRRITLGTVFEPLIRYVPPDAGQTAGRYTPRLARSWRVMPNGLEVRIEIEQGVKFHDGRPLTTSDVQFTLDAIRDPRRGVSHIYPMLEDIEAVELITTYEIRLRLKRPSGWVLRALAEIPILPMHVYDGSLMAGGALIGSGPYKVAQQKGSTIALARNDAYWGGPAAIANIELVYQPDAAIALVEAKRGDFDIIPALIPMHYPEQATAPGIATSFDTLDLRPPSLRYLAFNAKRPIVDDARVRHALGLLVNRRDIEKRVFDGLARPALWPVWPGGFVSAPEAAVPVFDPAAATKLLDAAGWTDSNKDGIRDRDGVQLKITMLGVESKPSTMDASGLGVLPPPKTERDYFVEAARRIGVVIEVKTGGESWVEKRIEEGGYDIAELSWSGMVDMDVSRQIGSKNPHVATSPRIDRVLDAMSAAWDPAERTKLASELVAALDETWPIAGIVADAPKGLVHKRVQNVRVWDGWIDLSQLKLSQ
jgi:peptide/nickel transport system substrate-binding protein